MKFSLMRTDIGICMQSFSHLACKLWFSIVHDVSHQGIYAKFQPPSFKIVVLQACNFWAWDIQK